MIKNKQHHSRVGFLIITSLLTIVLLVAPFYPVGAQSVQFKIGDEAVNQKIPNATFNTKDPTKYKQNFASLLGDLLSIVMPVAALLLLLYLLWGAIEWITSGGDKGKLEKARQKMTSAVMGVLVTSAVVSIFMLMQQILNVCIFDFWGNACGL